MYCYQCWYSNRKTSALTWGELISCTYSISSYLAPIATAKEAEPPKPRYQVQPGNEKRELEPLALVENTARYQF